MRRDTVTQRKLKAPAIEKAVLVMEFLGRQGTASFTQIQNELQLAKSSTFNLLETMVSTQLIIKNERGHFSLGIKLFELGHLLFHKKHIFQNTRLHMRELANKLGMTVHLGIVDGYDAVYLDKVENSLPATLTSWVGKRVPVHASALGKSLIAWHPIEQLDIYLDDYPFVLLTENTIMNKEKLMDHLEQIKKQGWAMDDEEAKMGIVCFSSPIFDVNQKVIYAISISSFKKFFIDKELQYYIDSLLECTRKISHSLGYSQKI